MASKVPPSLRSVGSYVKIANENANRDPVVYYWCLFYAVQSAMKLDKSSPEALQFITGLLSTLESIKKQLVGQEAITNEVVAQAHIENYALKLFNFADQREKAAQIDKATIQSFFTAGHLMDVLAVFGEIDENIAAMKKYAKWKCMQINQCLKDGTPYIPSSAENNSDSLSQELDYGQPGGNGHSNVAPPPPTSNIASYPDFHSDSSSGQYNYEQPNNSHAPAVAPHNPPSTNFAGYPNYSEGAVSSQPNPVPAARNPAPFTNIPPPTANVSSGKQPSTQDFIEAKKFTKYAISSIDYEDTAAAIDNLRKALALLE